MAITSSRSNFDTYPLRKPGADDERDEVTLEESEESLNDPANEDEADEDVVQGEAETAKQIRARLERWVEEPNIAKELDQAVLDDLGRQVVEEYTIDENSRSEWKDKAAKALDFSKQISEEKEYPWEGAANLIFPLITSAALRFGAIAYPALIPGTDVVRGKTWGHDKGTAATIDGKPGSTPKTDPTTNMPIWLIAPGEKAIRAERVGEHMSWQLLDEMKYWETQTDTMLNQIPVVGGAIRNTYRNRRTDKNESEMLSLFNLVWNMNAKSFETAPRHTEIQTFYPHEIIELERNDEEFLPQLYAPGDVMPAISTTAQSGAMPTQDPNDSAAAHTFLRQRRRQDLDQDGYPEPVIVTVHQRSSVVVKVEVDYDEDGLKFDDKTDELKMIEPCMQYTLYPFLPNPDGGSYPCGFGHYLKHLNEGINTTLNQMLDAGHLAIAGGGFFATGLSMPSGKMNFSMGEYKPVATKGMSIRDSVYQMQFPGPSEVLFQLLGLLISAGKEVASIQDMMTGDTSLANTAPTTMMILVDQGMRLYTAIYKRIYRAMKSELGKLYRLNRIYVEDDTQYQKGDDWLTVTPQDYRIGGGVEPMADPKMVTDSQRLTRAAMVVDRAEKSPLVNKLAAERYLFEAAGIPRVSDYLPDKMPDIPPSPDQITAQANAQKAKTDSDRAEIEKAEAQSKLGLTRAQELQAYTQAMVNFAKAKASMSEPQIAFMENQLAAIRLQIEATNASVRAADVDAKMHGQKLTHHAAIVGHSVTHHGNLEDVKQRARELANAPRPDDAGPPDTGGGNGGNADVPQQPSFGDVSSGLPAMAPSPGDQNGDALPGTPPAGPVA